MLFPILRINATLLNLMQVGHAAKLQSFRVQVSNQMEIQLVILRKMPVPKMPYNMPESKTYGWEPQIGCKFGLPKVLHSCP